MIETLTILNELVAPLLAAVASALAPVLIKYLSARLKAMNIEVDAATEAQVISAVDDGIHFAEEQGRKTLSAKIDATSASTSEKKRATAISAIIAEMNRRKLPAMTADEVAQLVESRLGVLRKDPGSPVVDDKPEPKEKAQ